MMKTANGAGFKRFSATTGLAFSVCLYSDWLLADDHLSIWMFVLSVTIRWSERRIRQSETVGSSSSRQCRFTMNISAPVSIPNTRPNMVGMCQSAGYSCPFRGRIVHNKRNCRKAEHMSSRLNRRFYWNWMCTCLEKEKSFSMANYEFSQFTNDRYKWYITVSQFQPLHVM